MGHTRKVRLRAANFTANDVTVTGFTAELTGRLAPPPAVNLLTKVDGPLAGTGDVAMFNVIENCLFANQGFKIRLYLELHVHVVIEQQRAGTCANERFHRRTGRNLGAK
jgi:hypothetical protein